MRILVRVRRGLGETKRREIKDDLKTAFSNQPQRPEVIVKATKRVGDVAQITVKSEPRELRDLQLVTGRIDAVLTRNGIRFCTIAHRIVKNTPPQQGLEIGSCGWW